MAKERKRVVLGLTTTVGNCLRILNGDVESLHRFRSIRGRPKKYGSTKVVALPEFPGKQELREYAVRDGFRLVRHREHKEEVTRKYRSLQARFNELCSEVRVLDPGSQEYREVVSRFDSGKVGRIERAVPVSFCCCEQEEEDEMSCLVHGLKRTDCDCSGINGLSGYRTCGGHRVTGQMVGVAPFVTDRMRAAKESADQHAREIGWE